VPAITAVALRFVISGVIGVGLALALGQNWRFSRAQWRAVLIFGFCQNAIYLGFNWYAMQKVPAGLAAIIAATMPLIVAAISRAVYGVRLAPLGLAGLAAGFVGVALIMGARLSEGADAFGILLCIIAVIALAIATLAVRSASASGNLLMIVGLQMLVGAVVLAPYAIYEARPVTLTVTVALNFLYTILVPGLAATYIWFLLVGRVGATRAATFHFLNPVFGVTIAALLLGEHFGWLDLVGVVVTTLGILAVQLSRQV
jgi:probable blue pigment (indigoidine) exporter